MVGVNTFREEDEDVKINIFRTSSEMQKERIEYVKRYKRERDQEPVNKALDALYKKAAERREENIFGEIMGAVEAGATVGEISDTLRRAENFEIVV